MRYVPLLTKAASSLLVVALFGSVVITGKHDREVEAWLEEPAPWFFDHYQVIMRRAAAESAVAKQDKTGIQHLVGRATRSTGERA